MFGLNSQHQKNVAFKHAERDERIKALPQYNEPLTAREREILGKPVAEVVKLVRAGELDKRTVLKVYGKEALASQKEINAITEVMIKDAERWSDEASVDAPLAGFPVSLKDPIIVSGYDASGGYSAKTRQPYAEDGPVAQIVKLAGGVPYVKTNMPITMMNIEGYNDIFGRTNNPHNLNHAPGGSSQGEAALIGYGGSRIGVGTDIGGSVRVPAAWCGIYSLRTTSRRFPQSGDSSDDGGFEGIPAVASPMARTLPDLRYLTEAIMGTQPWKYDYQILPMPWRSGVTMPAKPKVGILNLDAYIPPSPAQRRALDTAVSALRKQGADVVDFALPEPVSVFADCMSQLYVADGMKSVADALLPGEHNDSTVQALMWWMRMPWLVRKSLECVAWLLGYKEIAHQMSLVRHYEVIEYYHVVAERERLRAVFRKAWQAAGVDFLILPPHPLPAVPKNNEQVAGTVLYTALFNMLDYPAGIVPVSRVSEKEDALPAGFKPPSSIESKIAYDLYDPKAMAGLPTAVQIVGLRYHEEETMAAMEYTVEALRKAGVVYK